MVALLEENAGEVQALCARLGVEKLDIFGSATREDFSPDASDLDFLVQFSPSAKDRLLDRYLELAESLERIYGRPVDLLTERSLKNPILKATIARTRQRVYGP